MNEFYATVEKHIRKNRLTAPGERVLVACSGGIDSMVLLHLLKQAEPVLGITVSAVHVNHMLRGEESLKDRQFTETICREWGIPCFSKDIPADQMVEEHGGNRQDVYRRLRYGYFAEVLRETGADKLATAHHADDQMETVLMNGARGTLHTGTFGIPVRRPFSGKEVIRPLLGVTRPDIEKYAAAHGIPFREDASNQSSLYTRNRIRKEAVPLLKRENPSAAVHFARLAASVQEDQQFLEQLTEERLASLIRHTEEGITLSAQAFRSTAPALQKRLVPLLLTYLYPQDEAVLTVRVVEQVQELLQRSTGTVFLHLPKNRIMIRRYDEAAFVSRLQSERLDEEEILLSEQWTRPIKGCRYRVVPVGQVQEADKTTCRYSVSGSRLPLRIRHRKEGDRIHLPGMARPKKVARLMIDEKVPLPERGSWPLIVSKQEEILLIPGLRRSKLLSDKCAGEGDWVLMEQHITPPEADLQEENHATE